jgi:hypothetical protein
LRKKSIYVRRFFPRSYIHVRRFSHNPPATLRPAFSAARKPALPVLSVPAVSLASEYDYSTQHGLVSGPVKEWAWAYNEPAQPSSHGALPAVGGHSRRLRQHIIVGKTPSGTCPCGAHILLFVSRVEDSADRTDFRAYGMCPYPLPTPFASPALFP